MDCRCREVNHESCSGVRTAALYPGCEAGSAVFNWETEPLEGLSQNEFARLEHEGLIVRYRLVLRVRSEQLSETAAAKVDRDRKALSQPRDFGSEPKVNRT